MFEPVFADVVKKGNYGLGDLLGTVFTRSDLFPTSTISALSVELSLISLSHESIVSILLGSLRS